MAEVKKQPPRNLRDKDFKVNAHAERVYSTALKRKALEIARAMSKAKTVEDINRIVKRYGNNPAYIKWAERTASKMVEGQNFKSKQLWRMYFNKYQGKKSKTLAERLKKLVDDINIDDIIKDNEKIITSFPESMGEKAREEYRRLVRANITGGKRASQISKYLKNIGINRADLIARTETGKAATAVSRSRSESLGLKAYIWKTSLDKRVRFSHRTMRNVICFWNEQPIPGKYEPKRKNYRPAHPGEDFGCRCIAVVIVAASQVRALSKGGRVYVWIDGTIQRINAEKVIEMLGVE